jgi:hypothetical protein
VLDIMMASVAETVDYQLQEIFGAVGRPEQHLPIDLSLDGASPSPGGVVLRTLEALRKVGNAAAQKRKVDLNRFTDLLLNASWRPTPSVYCAHSGSTFRSSPSTGRTRK